MDRFKAIKITMSKIMGGIIITTFIGCSITSSRMGGTQLYYNHHQL